jgi:formiminotetrahydrofolate cyclodeaminase
MIDASGETIDGFLARLASDAPAPGGGAAAALAVALGAALVAMVCRVTRKRQPDAPAAIDETAEGADRLREAALRLGAEDSNAYARVLEARRQAPERRPVAVAEALKRATDVPVATARAGRDVLAAGAEVAALARISVLNDLDVAAALAWAGLEAGAATARSNLTEVEDEAYVTQMLKALARLIDEGARLRRQLGEVVVERQ